MNIGERVEWIDVAKGLTMIFVIVGHCGVNQIIRGSIFSFHMALFFILSIVTFRLSNNDTEYLEKRRKAFKYLFLSAACIVCANSIIRFCIELINTDFAFQTSKRFIADEINSFVFSSGVAVTVGDSTVAAIGIPWFLICLFFGRTMFDYCHLKLNGKRFYLVIALCSVVGVGLSLVQWLPFSFDIVLAIQPLFLVGVWIKSFDIKKKTIIKFCVSFAIWSTLLILSYLIKRDYLEFADRRYPLFPLCYICAISGTIMISCISQMLLKIKLLCVPLKVLGKNSMKMLWVHCFDMYWMRLINCVSNVYIYTLIRIIVDCFILAFVMLIIRVIRKNKVA